MPQAPDSVRALAAAYTCGHCNSNTARLAQAEDGMWHIGIEHDDGCPVLNGTVSDIHDTLRALRRSA
ncbi:hypothetical protein [Streptomyces noursei]|uniref:hypothetical protein n=1 Tax=Streptomyces noursei TaxID=1971 RepID=UPI0035DDAD5D